MTLRAIGTPLTAWNRSIVVGIGLAAVATVVVMAFLWPSYTASPKGLPIVLAGTTSQISPVEAMLKKESPGTFKFKTTGTRAEAITLIRDNEDYGGIALGSRPDVLTAAAANPAVAQLLDGLALRLQAQRLAAAAAQHVPPSAVGTVRTTDIVPLLSTDPRGTTIEASSIPMVIGGIVGGALLAVLIVGVWRRVLALTIYAVVGSIATTGVLQGWFGGLDRNYFLNTCAIALVLLGIGGVILGCVALLGPHAIAVGPVLFLLGATPISAAAVPVEFLSKPWGIVGQWFPPGASATLLRRLSYFPHANTAFVWSILAAWAALGLILSLLGHFRQGAIVEGQEQSRRHSLNTGRIHPDSRLADS